MMWPFRTSVDSDRLLLKRCSEGDVKEQKKFAGRSYLNEVFQTVRFVLDDDYHPDKVDEIATLIVEKIYKLWPSLPSNIWDLRTRIRRTAKRLAIDWRKQDLS